MLIVRIVFYTSGVTGIGRLILGMSIGNALERKGVSSTYTIVHMSSMERLAVDFNTRRVPYENEAELSPTRYRTSVLYKTIRKLKPDLLIVNHQWHAVHHFIKDLPCKKIYLSDHAYEKHFNIPLASGELAFDATHYDRVIAIEPFESPIQMERINPLVMRNRDEILPRDTAMERLRLHGDKKVALFSFSADPERYSALREKYSYLDDEYDVIETSIFGMNLFPTVDYFNAFDLIVCGGGYNQVWEAVFFKKKALFESLPLLFSDHSIRIEASKNFSFDVNGADQLVGIITNLLTYNRRDDTPDHQSTQCT